MRGGTTEMKKKPGTTGGRDRLSEYQRRKRMLERQPLSPEQYERAILSLCRELRV